MKKKLFGTDGIRGKANQYPITPEIAMLVGKATAKVLGGGSGHKRVVLGKDTRISGYMLENAITSGLLSMGMDVLAVGPMPTPAVAHLTRSMGAVCGIMITASHNPACDNGIKIFAEDGFKLPDSVELEIEKEMLEGTLAEEGVPCENIGKAYRIEDARGRYIEYAKGSIQNLSLRGLRIVLDCANGSSAMTAETLFTELGAKVHMLHDEPNGTNINDNCGSTHMESLVEYVKTHKVDAGIAFDGDADRCLAVDENGEVIDGDFIMAICGLDMKSRGKLNKDCIVGTIMTNLGFVKCCEANGIHFEATKVGDRYVLEEMLLENYSFGGEQSGHVIFRDFATTGDGQLTAAQLLSILKQREAKLSSLKTVMERYPQTMVNIKVSPEGKLAFHTDPKVKKAIQQATATLNGEGRVIVRPSGTEPLLRVMVEGRDLTLIEKLANDISEVIKEELV